MGFWRAAWREERCTWRVARGSLHVARRSSLREKQPTCKAWAKRAWFLQRICNFCLKASKNLWICLVLLKNRWLKYRFFALFRRAFRDVTFGSSVASWALSSSLIFSPSLNDLPEKCTKSEWFCRFFSPYLSKFTQIWCAFQASNQKAVRRW